jgi:hypothetical protein
MNERGFPWHSLLNICLLALSERRSRGALVRASKEIQTKHEGNGSGLGKEKFSSELRLTWTWLPTSAVQLPPRRPWVNEPLHIKHPKALSSLLHFFC